ncbi:PREDICTED: uncharacterized protein LOC109473239 [Branchiostoma belcheri]|uniref:Uncharacterized protein LOC109473239 n=1 Tax=Branchiostoma belcheri TaxID=7741 RepID=A0A6P4YWF7_BRABE|nr:PREDICTED: uncharacterized protein LOC109473239 [Branchiostoma belcheri]
MRIGWSNCTPSKWSKEPWEVAKVFMPKDPTADNTGPEKSDPAALLNFLIHCTYCKKYVRVKSSQKVIEVRNQTMHSKDLTFDPQTFNNHMDKLLRLMGDRNLTSDPAAQKAADEILKIKKSEFHIGANKACLDAEIRVFREFMAEQEKFLQLHKEELEDHGTRLDSLEGSIPPVEEILKTLGPILDIVNNNPDLQHFLKDQAMELFTISQQLQDRLGNVEGAVSQLEETVAEHGVQIDVNTRLHEEISDKISDVQQKLGQLKPPSSSTSFSSDEQTSAFTSALTTNYSNTLKTLKPLPWDDRFCLDLDKIFTRLLLISTKGLEDRAVFYKSLDDVFDHQPESPGLSKRFNVLVVGDAGSGKSTLFSKTALDWSCKKGRLADRKKIVLLIRLREVEPGESIAEIVWDQCVTKSAKGISISSIETCLQDYESDLVFLLDGYDELVPDAKGPKQAVPELLAKKWYPNCMVIVTSRPSSGIERYMAVDCRVKVLGFSSPLVDKYVPLYFKSVGKPDLVDSLVKVLDSKANIVARGLIQTPMFLMLICVLWEENPTIVQFPVTMSGLYQELLTCVIRKYCVREGLPIPSNKKEIPSEVSAGLCHLGKLALESLLRGESHVVLEKTAASQNTDVLLKLGLVSKEVSASRLHPREQLNFPHKSMQEFLAARYFADRVNTSSDDLHSLVSLDTLSAVLRRRNLVQFICGCGGKVTSKLLEHLNNLYVTEGASLLVNIRKWDDEEQDYVEYFGKGKCLQSLCMMSLYEGHDAQHLPILSNVFSSLDLYINELPRVLRRHQEHGCKLKPKKCIMFRRQVRYVGKLVTAEGYTMDPEDMAAVNALKEKTPTTVGDVRKLLGFLGGQKTTREYSANSRNS